MLPRLLRLCAAFLLFFSLGIAKAPAQAPPAEGDKTERSTSALPYVFVVLYAMLVLMIVCVPSRKA